ncbi:MAG: hypothetical protein V5A50_11415, partial [Thiohalorhabdus sp.]|uniref:hypothetical protein n=1 Tax=Thiohalorhabdus sp. TaxID=3094134 RepID=UPI002FC38429
LPGIRALYLEMIMKEIGHSGYTLFLIQFRQSKNHPFGGSFPEQPGKPVKIMRDGWGTAID